MKSLLPFALMALVAVVAFYAFPYNLAFLTRVVITMILVLSLDLLIGVTGIDTLGQAALYGTGAYAAGLFAVHVWADPVAGLLVGGLAGAVVAFVSGLLLMRTHGLTLLMLTIAVAEVFQELANKLDWLTGGADGLGGITMNPVFGTWQFDFIGQTGYIYAVCVLFIVTAILKVVIGSPFGLSLRGIKDSPARMRAIGTPVGRRRVAVYTLAGAVAGIAGALAAQSTALVSLSVYDFQVSAEAMIMLILGGTGRLWGALIGTAVFMAVHEVAASVDPFNWLFIIGFLVLAVVYAVPRGLIGLPEEIRRMVGRLK
ncbi:branched-chain amino acid ABC transporter permease [Solirhodobacter olei]|uniref:branched-chain amino acid ABC transporter permease n=1 Tax=Solirhodobacter olei TaxID=2493082 RepID=UPI000FD98EA1|nr:branched-chain amino acid ABC transporter permease [Solirhodobacter olei]